MNFGKNSLFVYIFLMYRYVFWFDYIYILDRNEKIIITILIKQNFQKEI